MTARFSTEKGLSDFLLSVQPKSYQMYVPSELPTSRDKGETIVEKVKNFKSGCETYWLKSNFSLLQCSDELRKNEDVICRVIQWFPRELRNAHPEFLENKDEVSSTMNWWFNKVIPVSAITRKQAFEWTLFFLKPSIKDLWFYKWYCLEVQFSLLPKKLQTREFFISAIEAYPRIADRIVDFGNMRANEISVPAEFMEDIQFKIDVYNACVKSGLFDQRWNHNFHAENLVKKFAMMGTPFYEKILRSDKPLDDLASAIGAEPLVA